MIPPVGIPHISNGVASTCGAEFSFIATHRCDMEIVPQSPPASLMDIPNSDSTCDLLFILHPIESFPSHLKIHRALRVDRFSYRLTRPAPMPQY